MPNVISCNLLINRTARRIVVSVFMLLTCCMWGTAQSQVSVGNQFIRAHVATEQTSGKFWITAGPAYNDVKFLFQSGNQITSHIVFRVKRSNSTVYYCNVPIPWMNARPRIGGQDIQFKPYDSIGVGKDTLTVLWKGLSGFNVKMRFIPEKPRSIYDNGSDMLLEFAYEQVGFGSAELGILMMLDEVNGEATSGSGGGWGDKSSFISDLGYFPVSTFSRKFVGPQPENIPEFYHVGNFLYVQPMNTVFPIHKLKGTTHYGTPLTPPAMIAFGDWKQFWDIGWDYPADLGTRNFEDAATLTRWEGLTGAGVVRTSFGMNNKGANDMYTCRDDSLFADIRTRRLVTQAVKNGPYDYETFEVEMWLSNLNIQFDIEPTIRIATPIASIPDGTGRLTLDPSTPATQSIQLRPRGTGKLTWRLRVNRSSIDTMARLVFYHKMTPKSFERQFKDRCEPLITVIGYEDPPPLPPPDTLAPVIERTGSGRGTTAYWNFSSYDRHLQFKYDKGIDRISIVTNDDANFRLDWQPNPFMRCDTSINVDIVASVIDTSRYGRIVFSVRDCNGNESLDSAVYIPRPDPFKPIVDSIVAGPAMITPACNARVYEVYLSDSVNQEAGRGDHGFGTIEPLLLQNFDPLEINFHEGGVPIGQFDPRASFRARVTNILFDGMAVIRVADYAGNADTLTLSYCTIPDTAAPKGYRIDEPDGMSWRLAASDSLPWDRGLQDIIPLSNLNDNILYNGVDPMSHPWTIIPGTAYIVDLGGLFTVKNDKLDAELVLEIRDTRYQELPEGHADTIVMRFFGTPDTLAPNFLDANFRPDPGSSGLVADVEVNDIHMLSNNEVYRYDLGLATITVDQARTSPNIRIRPSVPISFSPGDKMTTFQIEVIDSLAHTLRDSICLEATDIAGNRSVRCYSYPSVPDGKSPIFIGSLDAGRTMITGVATDNRTYDRGLSSITIENGMNIDPNFALTNLNGAPSTTVSIPVLDPTKPIRGTIVVRDIVGEGAVSAETQVVHVRRLPFYLPTASVALKLPAVVEGGTEFDVAVIAADSIPAASISQISFQADYTGNIEYRNATGIAATALVTSPQTTSLDVNMTTGSGGTFAPGDTLMVLRFAAGTSEDVQEYRVAIVPGSERLNGGVSSLVTDAAPQDTATSMLLLPPMLVKLNADSLAYTNGECGRVLSALGASKRRGLAILRISPQPIGASSGSALEVIVRDTPAEGALAELVMADGTVVAASDVAADVTGNTGRVLIDVPKTLSSGVYFLRVTGATGTDWAKIVVAE